MRRPAILFFPALLSPAGKSGANDSAAKKTVLIPACQVNGNYYLYRSFTGSMKK